MTATDRTESSLSESSLSESSLGESGMSESSLIEASNKKLAVGMSAIFLGAFGVHKFILGYTRVGVIMLVVTLVTCGLGGFVMGVVGVIEGIIVLAKTPEDFAATYLQGQREWF